MPVAGRTNRDAGRELLEHAAAADSSWKRIRELFALEPGTVYLNTARSGRSARPADAGRPHAVACAVDTSSRTIGAAVPADRPEPAAVSRPA